MRFRRIAATLALSGTLAMGLVACGSADNPGPPPPCPRIVTVSDAAHLTRFQGPGRDVKDVQFEAQIGELQSSCVYIIEPDNKTRIETTLRVQTIASRGPAMTAKSAQFQYFVAIAKIGGQPLARQAFDVEIDLEGNAVRAQSVDELTETIPLVSGENGDNYVIYVGIVLTPDELKFNRADSTSTIVAPSSP